MNRDVMLMVVAVFLSYALGVATGALVQQESHRCPARPVTPEDFRP
jgi:hypothetical protein